MAELKNCPFCGFKGTIDRERLEDGKFWYWCSCRRCSATTRKAPVETLAVVLWNARSADGSDKAHDYIDQLG